MLYTFRVYNAAAGQSRLESETRSCKEWVKFISVSRKKTSIYQTFQILAQVRLLDSLVFWSQE